VIELHEGCLRGIVEKPVYDNLVSAGIYVLSPQVLQSIPPNTVLDMPDLLLSLVKDAQRVGVFKLEDEWVDVGRHDDLERVRRSFASRE
jgi:NDP-sugar pyrophosphorylase family protein